jgi:hypothetical protein
VFSDTEQLFFSIGPRLATILTLLRVGWKNPGT